MFSSFTCSATCSRVAIHQQEREWRGGFSLLPRLPLPPSPLLCRLLLKPHTNFGSRGRIIACLSEASSEGQDEQRSAVSAALEESMPIKDLITIAACAVGLLTGIGVVLFNYAVHYLRDFFWDGIPSRGASWLREEPIADVWPKVILVPLCGGLIVSILNKLRDSLEDLSEGTDTVASAAKGALRPFLKTIAASVTLGTGNSLGPEGPSVEIGSSVGKGISHVFAWSGGKSLSLVAAGSAAGISSGFNAAVAGCFFAVESVLWPSSTDSFLSLTNSTSMVILSSVIASVISEVGLGSDPAFMVPEYDFRSPSELPLYLLLGILCGLVSLTLSGCTSFALEMVENFHKITRIPKTTYPAFGGMVVGLIALAYPEVLYWGFENVDILLESRPFVNGLPADVLFQLVGVKIVATSLSRASGLVGGYYAPSLFIGAATGMAYGKFMSSALSGPNPLLHLSLLEVASPQAYGLVGMAATLAGVCQVPLTSVLLLFELTQDYRIVLPLLGAVGVSSWIVSSQNKKKDAGNRLSTSGVKEASVNQYKESIYQGQVLEASTETSGVTDLCQMESSLCVYDSVGEIYQLAEKLTVSQAMRTRYVTVLMSSSLVEAVSLMLVENQPCAIIIDASGFLVGLLSLEDIQNFSKVAKKRGTQTEVDKILVSHVCHLVGKKCQAWAVTPDTTLATAESIMNSRGVNQLAVVSEHADGQKKGQLVGLLDRESISIACRAAATKESLGLFSENL
ncbi:Chloride channel voltage gated protein [Dioscorea alata]|uniref:Chloride channel voltage gated protein n=1 Tax=Dioscorea alata TaxID=55571 RepID=A0ACB7WMW0_DIOAL|nr:Chloride channel voltage gated protein [Dioscorea alata]